MRMAVAALVVLQGCAVARAPLSTIDAALTAKLEASPDSTGELIYEGKVVDPEAKAQTFRYERRVSSPTEGGSIESTHLTTEFKTNKLAVVQIAKHTAAYAVESFEVINAQTGSHGTLFVTPSKLTPGTSKLSFTLTQGERVKTAHETATDPVVVGPTLFGFMAAHWQALDGGQSIPVRFVVTDSLATYPFTIRKLESRPGEAEFVMEGAGIVSLAVKPQHFVFDPTLKRIIRYEGRVPQRRDTDGSLSDLDARVDYTHFTDYR